MFVLRFTSAFVFISSVFGATFDCFPCECKNDNCDIVEADCSARTTETHLSEIPKHLGNYIEYLDITGQVLNVLVEKVFENANLTGLKRLTLKNCQISEINRQAFANVNKLTNLDASDNNVSYIDNGTFSSMKNLTTLDLTNNFIQNLTFSQSLTQLETLLLNNNGIAYLDENVFVNNSKLESLELSNNTIEILPDNLLTNLIKLKYLHLSYNKISIIPNNTFQNNSELLTLFLKNNAIAELPENLFYNLTNLINLDLQQNKIKAIPENIFQNLSNLQSIQLSYNELETIPNNTFKNISGLNTLDLSHNKLNSLNTGFVEYSSCSYEFAFIYFHLNNNNISSLPAGVFKNACHTLRIDLSYNKISSIDSSAFSGADILDLNLSHNNISFLSSNTFNDISMLDLSFNRLSILPDGIFDSIIIALNVNNNNIETIYRKWFSSDDYVTLLIANNNITYFDLNLTHFYYLDMSNNPINCDCKLKKQHEIYADHMLVVQCATPLSLKGNWNILKSNQFVCGPEIRDNFTETINGTTHHIGCKVYASPAPDVQWLKNNKTIRENDTTVIRTRTNDIEDIYWYNLTFAKNATDFAGQYSCVLNNSAGEAYMNFTVLQQVHPTPKPTPNPSEDTHTGIGIWITVVVLVVIVVLVALVQVYRKRRQRLLYDPLDGSNTR